MKFFDYTPLSAVSRPILACLSFFAVSAASSFAQAVDSSDADENEERLSLSPFLVAAEETDGYRSEQTLVGSRTAKSLMEVPASLSIINRQQIDDLNAVQVSEVLKFGTAGVTQNQTINDDVNIRGFRTSQSLRNGVTKTSFKRNPMFDVERVEVIKGPGAMLLGNNSFLGGGVNFVTMKPTSTPSGDLQVTFGENSHVRFAGNLMGPLYDSEQFKANYRLTLGGLSGDTYREIEEEDQIFLGGGLALYFGDNTSIFVNAYYFRDNGYFYWEDFLDYSSVGGTAQNPKPAVLNPLSTKSFSAGRGQDAFWDNEDSFIDVTYLNRLTDNTNLRMYYFTGILNDNRRHVRGIAIQPDNYTLARQDIPLKIDSVTNNFQGDLTNELVFDNFKLTSTVGFDLAWGTFRQDLSVNNPGNLDTRNPDYASDEIYFSQPRPGAGLPNTNQSGNETDSLSYYFQENLSFLQDKLILVGGLRWFNPGGFNRNYITDTITRRPSEGFDTHKYGIVIRPIPAVSLYYTDAANAFPQSGLTDRFQGNDQLGDPLDTQEGTLEEFGIKIDYDFTENISGYGSLVFYDMSLTNVRTFGVLPEGNPPGSVGIIQSPGDIADGWELEYGLRFTNSDGAFDLIGTYADGNSETAGSPDIPAQDFVPSKISLMGRYEWTSGNLEGLALGATYFDQDAKRNAAWTIDFPATYNVFARYRWNERWSVQMNLNNLTDERYIVAIAANGLVQTQPGMESRLSIRYKW